jgi:uncharacterized protein YbcI
MHRSLARVSDAVVRLHARHYGKGPRRARTFAFDDFVLCLLRDPYTTAEKTLLARGQQEAVRENRLLFYRLLEAELRSAVDEIIGRKTIASLPQLSFDPPVVSALFLLEPDGDRDRESDGNRDRTASTSR